MSEECWPPAALAAGRKGPGDGGLVIPEAAAEEEPSSSSVLSSVSSSLQSMGSAPEELFSLHQVIPEAAAEEEPSSTSALLALPLSLQPMGSAPGELYLLHQVIPEAAAQEEPSSTSALPALPSSLQSMGSATQEEFYLLHQVISEEETSSSSAPLLSGVPCFLPQVSGEATGEEDPCSSKAPLAQSTASAPRLPQAKYVCSGCGLDILDKYLLKVNDVYWHMQCLCCSECQASLGKHATCYIKDNTIFCKIDYLRKFGTCCCGCGRFVRFTDWVQKVQGYVYHLVCFACFSCKRQLCTGEEFALVEEKVLCKVHFNSLMDRLKREVENGNRINIEDALLLEDMKSPKPFKRARTNFTVDQLQIMQDHYTQEKNPNAQALQKLSERTGLSRKIIQVWFQNCRARYKKQVSPNHSSTTLMRAVQPLRPSQPMLRQMPYPMYPLQNGRMMMTLHGYRARPSAPLGLQTLILPRYEPQLPIHHR